MNTHTTKFTSAAFDPSKGTLYTGCQAIKQWQASINAQVEIKALQVETMSKALLKERNLDKAEFQNKKKESRIDVKNSNVLIAPLSTLVEILLNENDPVNCLITIDSENLLRAWNMQKNQTVFSYSLSKIGGRVTAAAVDRLSKHLAIANNKGDVQVLNLKSGDTLYTLPHSDSEVTSLKFVES